jgi:hypothetical protein
LRPGPEPACPHQTVVPRRWHGWGALDAIHVATAEILAAEAEGESLEFWTHDERQATAAMSRGLTVRGLPDSLP